MLQYAQYDMAKFLLINPANSLFGKNFKLRADMRAGIRIGSSINAHMPWKVIDEVNVTESKWPML